MKYGCNGNEYRQEKRKRIIERFLKIYEFDRVPKTKKRKKIYHVSQYSKYANNSYFWGDGIDIRHGGYSDFLSFYKLVPCFEKIKNKETFVSSFNDDE